MPEFLEKKLKAQYGANSATPYKIMNKLGFMKGNKETSKGAAAETKHMKDKKSVKKVKLIKAITTKAAAAYSK